MARAVAVIKPNRRMSENQPKRLRPQIGQETPKSYQLLSKLGPALSKSKSETARTEPVPSKSKSAPSPQDVHGHWTQTHPQITLELSSNCLEVVLGSRYSLLGGGVLNDNPKTVPVQISKPLVPSGKSVIVLLK